MQNLLRGVNIYLIGMMGSGKSTLGKLLAKELSYRFFDTDALLEKVLQQSVKEIFAEQGEESFRNLETKVLGELAACVRSVIATGGGIVLRQENWSYLHHGLVVWLDVPVEVLSHRLAKDDTRPLLSESNRIDKLNSLLEQRSGLYAQADLRIITENGQTPEETLKQLLEKIPTVLKSSNSFSDSFDDLHT